MEGILREKYNVSSKPLILEEKSQNTIENVHEIGDILAKRFLAPDNASFHSLLVVTSDFHVERTHTSIYLVVGTRFCSPFLEMHGAKTTDEEVFRALQQREKNLIHCFVPKWFNSYSERIRELWRESNEWFE